MAIVPNQTYKQSPTNIAHSTQMFTSGIFIKMWHTLLHVDKVLAEPETNVKIICFLSS